MSDDLLITPGSRKLEIKDTSGNVDAKIETDASGNLLITNAGGDISIGDTSSDVFIGDGTNNVDIVFEQNGEIRGTSGVTLTLGASGSSVAMATDLSLGGNDLTNVNDITISGNLTVNGTTTTVSSVNTTIADSLIELNSGLTGANTKDIGFIFERGTTGNNAAFFWDESSDRFRFITTTNTGSATSIADNISEGTIQAGSFIGNGSQLSSLNASNLGSGTVPSARLSLSASDIPNLAASKITSGTLDTARLPNPIHLSGVNAILKLQETDVTNSPTWWHVADGGNYSIRLNNTGNYPILIETDSDNDAVTEINFNYTVHLNSQKLQFGGESTSYIQNVNKQSTDVWRFQTEDGLIEIGSENSSWAHFGTDRNSFYFNPKITVDGNVEPYTDSTRDLGTNTLRWANVYADTLYGAGSNITGLNASNLGSGTVPDARIAASSITQHTDPKYLRSDANDTYTGTLSLAGTIQDSGDSRRIHLMYGTTNSQPAIGVGEQGTYGMKIRWDSGSKVEFDGFWNTSVTGARNRDLGDINVNTATWNLPALQIAGSNVATQSYAANASNLTSGTVPAARLAATVYPGSATELGSGTDLNDLNASSAGFYYQTANADTTGNNYPEGTAGSLIVQKSAGEATQLYQTYQSNVPKLYFRSNYTSGWGSWQRVFADNYHPNADTLTTARTIGGVSFNGSANIDLPGVNTAGNQNTSGTAAGLSGTPNITVGTISSGAITSSGTITSSGSGVTNVMSFSDRGIFGTTSNHPVEIRTNNTEKIRILADGKVGIGTTTPSAMLTAISTADATPAIKAQNTGGINGVIQEWIGDSNGMEMFNYDTGDYVLRNTEQNNGIIFRDGTGGLEFQYNGSTVLQIDNSGGMELLTGAFRIGSDVCITANRDFEGRQGTFSSHVSSGDNSGGVAMTINDGYGNANLTFNHLSGTPEQNGQAARIEVNTDGTSTEGTMHFEISSADVTSGVAVSLPTAMTLAHDYMEIPNLIRHQGDTNTYLKFDTDRIRLYAGGTVKIDTNNTYLTGITSSDVTTALGYTPYQESTALSASTITASGNVNFTNGILRVGADNTTSGSVDIYGGSSGAEGGEIRLHTTNDYDGTYEWYRIDAYADDFRIGRQGQSDFYIFQNGLVKAETDFQASNNITVGTGSNSPNLIIDKSTTGNGSLLFRNAGNNKGKILLDSNEDLQFYINNTTQALSIYESTSTVTSHLQLIAGIAGNTAKGSIAMGPQTSGATKWSYLTGSHYNQTTGSGNGSGAAGIALIGSYGSSAENRVVIGGSIYESNPATSIEFWTHNAITHTTGGTKKITITQNGNLQFNSQTSTMETAAITYHTNNYLYVKGGSAGLILSDDGGQNTIQISDAADYIRMETGDGTERVRVNSSGLDIKSGGLLINGATKINSSGRLFGQDQRAEMNGNDSGSSFGNYPQSGSGSGSAFVKFVQQNFTGIPGSVKFYVSPANTNVAESDTYLKFLMEADGDFHADGDVIAYSTQTGSDIKLKENIRDLEGSLDKTLKLRGVKYDWKEEKRPNDQIGFIAQEVQEVVPEVVNENQTLTNEGETHLTVNYPALVPMLVEAIKEQQTIINRLEERINNLEKGEE